MTRLLVGAMSVAQLSMMGIVTASAQATSMVCGLEIYPSPIGFPAADTPPDPPPGSSGDPCEDGETAFGPVRFDRSKGQPETAMVDFDLLADANVCIRADASAKGKAFLYLDGVRISEPEDFDDRLEEQVHSLAAGSHGMGVHNVGKPGEYIDLEIRQLAETNGGGGDPGLPAPGEVQIDPDTGALDMVSADNTVRLQNVASDHPLLTPNGDGDNDTTVFQALTTPLVPLPGKDDGTVDYFLDWEFRVVNLDTCEVIDTGLAGMEQINSPTLVTTPWTGTDTLGSILPDGTYAYIFEVSVVDFLGGSLGSLTSPAFGIVMDSSAPTADFDEQPEYLGPCNPNTESCKCPGLDGEPGEVNPDCKFAFITQLLPELGLPPGTMPNYMNPEDVDKSFIETEYDPARDRYTVTVDLRDYNAGGLVPKARGIWADEATLRQWVSDMTGVPVGTGDSLFNFDYVQRGTSTGVDQTGIAIESFNHFFLDAITDTTGIIRVSAVHSPFNLSDFFNDDVEAPPQYQVPNPRVGDECSHSGNTDGVIGMRTKFCAYNTAFPVSALSDLGVYGLRTTTFDIEYNNMTSEQDNFCVGGTCGVRSHVITADLLEIEADFYIETATDPLLTRSETTEVSGANGVSFTADRESSGGESGVCANSVATRDGLAVRMDSADGTVPDTCIINGIF